MEEKEEVMEVEFDIVEPDIKKPEFEIVEEDGSAKVEIINFSDPVLTPSQVGTTVELRKSVVYGSARININEMTAFVDKVIADAKAIDIATADEKEIKDTQAKLNRLSDELNSSRIALSKEWMVPFDSFIADPVKALIAKIADGKKPIADKLAEINKAYEAKKGKEIADIKVERLAKESEAVHAFVSKLTWFDDPRWLNKGYTPKKIAAEVDEKVTRIVTDLKAIEGDFGSQLMEFYARSGDLGQTLAEKARLVKAGEEYARIQAEREAEQERLAREREAERERIEAERAEYAHRPEEGNSGAVLGVSGYKMPPIDIVPDKEQTKVSTVQSERVYGFEIKCTPEQMQIVANFINSQKIKAKMVKDEEVV